MKLITDKYTRRARLEPALLVALPAGIAVLGSLTAVPWWVATLWSVMTWGGGVAFATQIARDQGKRKEPGLFASWGGKPTTRLLRHRGSPNHALLERRHKKLHKLVPELKLPTVEEEAQDPTRADEVYEAHVARLLEKTRNQTKFPLVFEENCNYGFRRNLWGMRPVGLTVAAVGTAVAGYPVLRVLFERSAPPMLGLTCLLINALLLLGWSFIIKRDWVRLPAEAYAERLLASCEDLAAR